MYRKLKTLKLNWCGGKMKTLAQRTLDLLKKNEWVHRPHSIFGDYCLSCFGEYQEGKSKHYKDCEIASLIREYEQIVEKENKK